LDSDYPYEYLVFAVSSELYGINLTEVMGVDRYRGCTRFPLLEEKFIGFAKINGKPVPLLNLADSESRKRHRQPVMEEYIITVKFQGELVGLLVNNVKKVIKVNGTKDAVDKKHQHKFSWQGKDISLVNTDELVDKKVICEPGADCDTKTL